MTPVPARVCSVFKLSANYTRTFCTENVCFPSCCFLCQYIIEACKLVNGQVLSLVQRTGETVVTSRSLGLRLKPQLQDLPFCFFRLLDVCHTFLICKMGTVVQCILHNSHIVARVKGNNASRVSRIVNWVFVSLKYAHISHKLKTKQNLNPKHLEMKITVYWLHGQILYLPANLTLRIHRFCFSLECEHMDILKLSS